jgi:hypothetical protein
MHNIQVELMQAGRDFEASGRPANREIANQISFRQTRKARRAHQSKQLVKRLLALLRYLNVFPNSEPAPKPSIASASSTH